MVDTLDITIALLASVFTLALASATWILGYRRGEKAEKARGDGERQAALDIASKQAVACYEEGKERGIREATPHRDEHGRFTH